MGVELLLAAVVVFHMGAFDLLVVWASWGQRTRGGGCAATV